MSNALLEILTGKYSDDNPINIIAEEDRMHHSIQSHLRYLLNTRQKSLVHQPTYGLPDVSEIYQNLPQSLADLIQQVKKTIERFEPRLGNVTVSHQPQTERDCVIHLGITGTVEDNKKLFFDTFFMSGGEAKIF